MVSVTALRSYLPSVQNGLLRRRTAKVRLDYRPAAKQRWNTTWYEAWHQPHGFQTAEATSRGLRWMAWFHTNL